MSNKSEISVKEYSKSFLTRKLLYQEEGTLKLYETPVSVTFEELIEKFQRDKNVKLDLKTGQATRLPEALGEVGGQVEAPEVERSDDVADSVAESAPAESSVAPDESPGPEEAESVDVAHVDAVKRGEVKNASPVEKEASKSPEELADAREEPVDSEKVSDVNAESEEVPTAPPPEATGQVAAEEASKKDDAGAAVQE